MTIEYITGDLLKSNEEHIAHGCNTAGVMGGGIARVIAEAYPVVRHQYQRACVKHEFVLGAAQAIIVPHEAAPQGHRTVWNLGTQGEPGPFGSLWAVLLSFGNMMEQMVEWHVDRVAIPRIGCGIARLKWEDVAATITIVQGKVGPMAPHVVVYTQESETHRSW